MAEIYQLPSDSGSNAGMGNIPFSIPIGGFGGGLFGNGSYGRNVCKQQDTEDVRHLYIEGYKS